MRYLAYFVLWLVGLPAWAGEPVVLQLKWEHAYQFAGYYVAQERGYYREAGLDVEIRAGGPGVDFVAEVVSDRAQYATGSAGLVLDRNHGKPVVVLAVVFQHSPDVLIVSGRVGITSPQQLVGKRVMTSQSTPSIASMLLNESGSLNKYTLLEQINDLQGLIDGKLDAVACYITDQPFFFRRKGFPVTLLRPIHYGVDFYGDNLFTSEKELEAHPGRVKAFRAASLRGWEYAMAHPDEVIGIIQKYGSTRSVAHLRFEYQAMGELVLPEFIALGHMHEGRWRHIADKYVELGQLNPDYSLDGFLYDPNPSVELGKVRGYVSVALGVIVTGCVAIIALARFNRRLRREIVERQTAEALLRQSEQRLTEAQRIAHIGSWEQDLASGRSIWSDETFRLLGYAPGAVEAGVEIYLEAIHPQDRARVEKALSHVRQSTDGAYHVEYRVPLPDGEVRVVDERGQVLFDSDGRPSRLIGTSLDITERKISEARIEFLAHHDPLTELPNRVLVREHFDLAVAFADRAGVKTGLLFLDLDNFKTVNDSLGHAIGDALLKEIARRLHLCVRETDTIGRQGGDEFLIVLFDVRDVVSIDTVTEKIRTQMAFPFVLDGQELTTSFSVGIAVYPDDGRDFETLLKKADAAMYHAKDLGRNTSSFYDEQMNLHAAEHLRLHNQLAQGALRGEFILHYQPWFDLASGRVVGAEALIRWNNPLLGLVPPGRFIPIAEDTGLIVEIGEWVLAEACRQASAWRKAGLPDLVVAVNLSAVQFRRGDLLSCVTRVLAETGLPPGLLELELTESILLHDTEKVLDCVQRLKSLGVTLSIDDFGTGYSSLAYLKRFNVDRLKIDQSFIRDIATDPGDAAMVRAIIQMAHGLNLKTIAEGVEDERQADFLRQEQCDEVQGYHFAQPLPGDEFARHLAERIHGGRRPEGAVL
jgi:diguanylate cyclase (GGDEF)-like protein/PAS domain S-box-containing protein